MRCKVKLAPGLIVIGGGVQDELRALDGMLIGVCRCGIAQDEIVGQYIVRSGAAWSSTTCLQL